MNSGQWAVAPPQIPNLGDDGLTSGDDGDEAADGDDDKKEDDKWTG